VARIGGDEFNILLSSINTAQEAAAIAGKIIDAFRLPFPVAGREPRVTTSIGLSMYPDDGEDLGELQKQADIAMYQAKAEGRNTYRFHQSDNFNR
jgi:diguanylate cyclase (GGDEF)-like protein